MLCNENTPRGKKRAQKRDAKIQAKAVAAANDSLSPEDKRRIAANQLRGPGKYDVPERDARFYRAPTLAEAR